MAACVSPARVGWRNRAPKGKFQRGDVRRKFGARCFLDPKRLKFPVCNKTTGCYDCQGIEAAYKRARQYGHAKIAAKAKRLGRRSGCHWARG